MMRRVYLDTCCIIYLLENLPVFSAAMRAHLTSNADAILCVSPLVRLEVLVKPLGIWGRSPVLSFKKTQNRAPSPLFKELLPLQAGDVPDIYANVDDLVEQFHYKPATTVKDGIQRFVVWYRNYYT